MDLGALESEARELTTNLDEIGIIDLGMEIINNDILDLIQGAGIEEDVIENSYTETEPQSLIDIVSKSSISDENKGLFFTWYIGTVTTILSKKNSPEAPKAPKAPEYPKPFLTRPAPHAPRGLRAIRAKRGPHAANGYNGNTENTPRPRKSRKRKSRKAKARKATRRK
jgi:hypothetical protein